MGLSDLHRINERAAFVRAAVKWLQCPEPRIEVRHVLPDSENVTALLLAYQQGSASARDQLIAVLYDELRHLAARYLRAERRDHTLQPTALVHELYVRLFTTSSVITWENRAHFFAVAAHTLRRILVDYARGRQAKKRGGANVRVSLAAGEGWVKEREADLVALDEALSKLAQLQPRAAQVVELRFFGGLQENEVAEVLHVAPITVKRDWRVAKAWLLSRLAARDQAERA
jgi:RNA polymerase sigma factor (TIGR02999 family)